MKAGKRYIGALDQLGKRLIRESLNANQVREIDLYFANRKSNFAGERLATE